MAPTSQLTDVCHHEMLGGPFKLPCYWVHIQSYHAIECTFKIIMLLGTLFFFKITILLDAPFTLFEISFNKFLAFLHSKYFAGDHFSPIIIQVTS